MSESEKCTSIINLRYQDGSEGSPSNPAKFNNQDYAQLKDNCLRRGRLFVDNTFPPNNQSLGDLPDLSSWREAQVEWLRPAVKYFFLPFSILCVFVRARSSDLFPLLFSSGHPESTKQQRWADLLFQRSLEVRLWSRQCWWATMTSLRWQFELCCSAWEKYLFLLFTR